ncbi:hypothetical protein [Kitasatospora purpeofusca]|uniref:hypothetical protein n=1 Tax=Kitasatospora purpeofusca TaxID=67352 RepID=UPI0036D250AE
MVLDVLDNIDREDTAAFNGLVAVAAAHMISEMVRLASRVCDSVSVGRLLEQMFHDPRAREAESWRCDPDWAVCGDAWPSAGSAWLAGTTGGSPSEPTSPTSRGLAGKSQRRPLPGFRHAHPRAFPHFRRLRWIHRFRSLRHAIPQDLSPVSFPVAVSVDPFR